jgi:hypothetical protein
MAEVNIIFKGVDFTVTGDYQPEEKMVMYYQDGTGYPGHPSEFHIATIEYDGIDVTDLITSLFDENEISALCAEKYDEEYEEEYWSDYERD